MTNSRQIFADQKTYSDFTDHRTVFQSVFIVKWSNMNNEVS